MDYELYFVVDCKDGGESFPVYVGLSPNQSQMQKFYIQEKDKDVNEAAWRLELMERFRAASFDLTMGTEDAPLTCTVSHFDSAAPTDASHAALRVPTAVLLQEPLHPNQTLQIRLFPPAAGNGRNAQVADPLLPLLAFNLQENLRSYKEVRIQMDTH